MVVALLASAGCGARWSDEQREALAAGGTGAAQLLRTGDPAASAAAQTGAAATGGPSTTVAAAVGSAGAPGQAGGGATAAAAGPAPCAAPSDAPGVTADTITVGTIATVSGPVPGLGASAVGAVRSYVAYRNATGGVCGRQIVLKEGDDGADNSRYRALVTEMAPQVLGLAGGFAGGDGGGAEVVASQNIPTVAVAFTAEFQQAESVFDINPPPADPNMIVGKYRYLFDQGVRKASLVYGANGTARAEIDMHRRLMEAAGIQVVNVQEVPLSTLSYDSTARAVANSGADYLLFMHEEGADASMAQAMRDTGYELKFEEYITGYGSSYLELAGAAAEGTVSWAMFLPNEEVGGNPEQAAYLEWIARTAPEVNPDVFAAENWASAKAFFDSLAALPGPITRDALTAQIRSVGAYDAGGFYSPINLGAEENRGCAIGVRVVGGAWKRFAPDEGFLC